jgi:hypothetical protein
MDTNRMRLGLMYIFKESPSLEKQVKLQLINFIEQANEYQLKMLALDGEIVPDDIFTEGSKEVIDARFKAETQIAESLKKASLEAIKILSKK